MSYKNTDIGLIPSEWDFDTIGDSLYIKGRIGWKGLKKSEYIDRSEYRIINGSNVVNNNIDWSGCGYISEERYEESPEIMLKTNDIVMTKDGTIGKLAIIRLLEQKTTVASGLFVIRVEDNSIDVDYLYYYFSSFYFKELVKSRIEGSVIPHLYQKDLVALKLPLPDLSEQKAISKILRTLDDKIEVNNQINKTLENMAQAIFKQWFVDFEFPNEDGEPYKSSGGEMVESVLGMIPKGWHIVALGEFGDFRNGKGIPEELRIENGSYSIFGSNGIIGKTNKILQYEPCIVVGRVGAYCGSIRLTLKPCWITDNAIIATPLEKIYLPYLYHCLINASLRELAGGSAQPLINQNILKNIKIIVPSMDLIRTFCNTTYGFMQKEEHNTDQNMSLTKIRDSLLPKLMSGEIRVLLDVEGEAS